MATDLESRAETQLVTITDAAGSITAALTAARDDLATAKSDQVAARAALDALHADESAIRASIAGVTSPADAETFEDQLRDVLVESGAARVVLRDADERTASAQTRVARLATAAGRADGVVRSAAAHVDWATERTAMGSRLRGALAAPPLDSLVADAGALLAGSEMAAADDRIDDLLPSELRSRAEARAAEAASVLDRARTGVATTDEAGAAAALAARPVDGAVDAAFRDLGVAEGGLAAYVGSAVGRLEWARHALERVAALGDLSDAQVEGLDAGNHPDGVTAAAEEEALASALATLADAQRDVDDAILAARIADPDGDPETAQDVIDARAALADPSVQDPVDDARTAYDSASRAALDAWEVEVPAVVWAALSDLVRARRILEELSSSTERAEVEDALGDAEDALAAALDARDAAVLAGWAVALDDATRAGALAAAAAGADDRARQYLQGDGVAGRVPAEL